jgi:TetR/AcrR family transcriptional regulator, transcriptional repressor for nem operon
MAGVTKGALFHYFVDKQALGYAIVYEVIGPLLLRRWLDPVRASTDPISDIQRAFRRFVSVDLESGSWLQGCPLNNLAQEMSPLDEGFHQRIDALYDTWRACFAAAIADGVKTGMVRKDVVSPKVAALIVASQTGIWGTGKSSQQKDVILQAAEALCDYLESLRP